MAAPRARYRRRLPSRVLTRFETESLVTRHRSAGDARRQEIRITDAGRAAMAELDRRSAAQIAVLLQGADCDRLLNAMRVITSELGRPEETAAPAPATTAPATTAPAPTVTTAPRVVTLRPSALGDLGWVLQRHAAVYADEFSWDASFEAVCARIIAEYTTLRDAHPGRTAGWIAEVDGVPAGSASASPTARPRPGSAC